MDSLQISGKQYISSNRAAKENGYTTDYIGQLIRADKLKGQKVGRAWYVLEDSLNEFLATEKGNTKAGKLKKVAEKIESIPEDSSPEIEEKEIEPESILKIVPKEEPEPEPEPEPIVEEKIEEQDPLPELKEIKEEEKNFEAERPSKPVPQPKAAHVSPPREELIKRSSVREHVLMTYMKEEERSIPKKREESIVPIRKVEEKTPTPAPMVTPHPRVAEPAVQRPLREKRRTWRAVFAIVLLGMLAGAGTAAASVLIPAILVYP